MRRRREEAVSELVSSKRCAGLGALSLLAVLLVGGCKKPPSPGSCYRPKENICLNYEADHAEAGRRLCTGLQWNTSPCASENRIGTCTKADTVEQYYKGAPNNYDPVTAKLACEHASGAWVSTP